MCIRHELPGKGNQPYLPNGKHLPLSREINVTILFGKREESFLLFTNLSS